jgi:hypothetical protein
LNRFYRESVSFSLIFFFVGLIGFITSSIIIAQEPLIPPPDSTLATAAGDTTDTLKTLTPPKSSKVEGPVKYWAEYISFTIPDQTTHLQGKAKIVYQNVTLTAGTIDIDWAKNCLVAEGVADSTDSLGNQVYRDLPVLTEKGEEPIKGFRLEQSRKSFRRPNRHGTGALSRGEYSQSGQRNAVYPGRVFYHLRPGRKSALLFSQR